MFTSADVHTFIWNNFSFIWTAINASFHKNRCIKFNYESHEKSYCSVWICSQIWWWWWEDIHVSTKQTLFVTIRNSNAIDVQSKHQKSTVVEWSKVFLFHSFVRCLLFILSVCLSGWNSHFFVICVRACVYIQVSVFHKVRRRLLLSQMSQFLNQNWCGVYNFIYTLVQSHYKHDWLLFYQNGWMKRKRKYV